jgi:hypothetical protein
MDIFFITHSIIGLRPHDTQILYLSIKNDILAMSNLIYILHVSHSYDLKSLPQILDLTIKNYYDDLEFWTNMIALLDIRILLLVYNRRYIL